MENKNSIKNKLKKLTDNNAIYIRRIVGNTVYIINAYTRERVAKLTTEEYYDQGRH